jgi:MFS family permease
MEKTHDATDLQPSAHGALRLASIFALTKLLIHIAANLWQTHLGWGYFRDEMYYILCGQHLDWGYVDHGPVVALQARTAILLFGKSLTGIRMLSAIAGAAMVFLTGMIAWQMGARRIGQALAMTGVLLAPEYLGLGSFLSMNSFEAVFWMTASFAILRLVNGGSDRLWILFGLVAGFGLENKPSMLVFLIALLIGLLLTPQRRILLSRTVIVAIALTVAIELPNLLWQIHHHWATLEFLHNGKAEHKNVTLSPLAFLLAQESMFSPVSLPLWLTGLVWLLVRPRGSRFRFFGLTYLIFLVLMMATRDAKDYYLAPIYPLLFAAGGCAWEALTLRSRTRWLVPAYSTVLVISSVIILPMSLPILNPQQWIRYTAALHLRNESAHSENTDEGPLPQFYADRFGWQEEVDEVTRIYRSLPDADRKVAGIICSNYGEASAINFLGAGRGLPFAISGHNNYYLWGPHGESGEVMIVVTGGTADDLRQNYNSVEVAGRMDHPYAMPYEHRNIYLCRGRKGSLIDGWAEIKHYI